MNFINKAIFIIIFTLIITSCGRFDIIRITKIETTEVTFNNNELNTKGNFIDLAESGTSSYGFCIGANPNPTLNDRVIFVGDKAQLGEFSTKIENIEANKSFFIRAFAKSGNVVVYGQNKTITTKPQVPLLNIDSVLIVNSKEIHFKSSINGFGSLKVNNYGFCWSFKINPTFNDFKTQNGQLTIGVNSIYGLISSPILDTTYHLKSYAILTDGTTYYSSERTFNIPSLKIQTDSLSANGNEIVFWGAFKNIGVDPIQEYGFCYSTNTALPTINDQKVKLTNAKNGQFTCNVPFSIGTTVYGRAYVIVNNTVKYGQVISKTF